MKLNAIICRTKEIQPWFLDTLGHTYFLAAVMDRRSTWKWKSKSITTNSNSLQTNNKMGLDLKQILLEACFNWRPLIHSFLISCMITREMLWGLSPASAYYLKEAREKTSLQIWEKLQLLFFLRCWFCRTNYSYEIINLSKVIQLWEGWVANVIISERVMFALCFTFLYVHMIWIWTYDMHFFGPCHCFFVCSCCAPISCIE